MGKYKVYVYAISKNEEAFVDRWMDSMGEADGVIVLDTGSTDGTVARLRARGAAVCEEIILPWRFDAARNAALRRVPEDADICVSTDLDEVFEPGWRAALESAWKPEHTRATYLYTWAFRADGTPQTQYPREKIHRRLGFRWVRPVHEVLRYEGPGGENPVWVEGLVLNHHPDPEKSRGQYLPLLELAAAEDPEDDRAAFWLGREYLFHGRYDRAIEVLKAYLKMPSARWDEERCAAMRFIARAYEAREERSEAVAWLYRAIAECPGVREPYLAMAALGYREENWPMTYAMAKRGLAILRPSGSYLVEDESWGPALCDYCAIAAHRLGLREEALACAEEALALDESNPRLRRNVELLRQAAAHSGGGAS